MIRRFSPLANVIVVICVVITSYGSNPTLTAQISPPAQPANETTTRAQGTLEVRANGEDFVRQGFTSKDGWMITFDNVYATLAAVTAYQTDPPYDPQQTTAELKAKQQVSLAQLQTVDLKTTSDKTVLVGEAKAPAGNYNALSWKMVKLSEGPAKGYPLLLKGKATKAGKTVDFTLKVGQELAFACGDFIGDDRKGTHKAGDKAADYKKMLGILPSLRHVGEGHCKATVIGTTGA